MVLALIDCDSDPDDPAAGGRACQKPFIQRSLLLIPPLLAGRDPGTSRRQVTLQNLPDGRGPNYAPLDASGGSYLLVFPHKQEQIFLLRADRGHHSG